MNRLRVCFLLSVFAVVVARAEGTNAPTTASVTSNAAPSGVTSNALPTSITIDGTTYENVRWGRVTPSSVTIFHRSGVATMPLWKLPPDLQNHFGYDPQKAADWQKREQQREQRDQQAALDRQRSKEVERLSKTTFSDPLKVGMVGVSHNGEIRVIHVEGTKDMLAKIYIDTPLMLGYGLPGTGGVAMESHGVMVGAPVYSDTEKDQREVLVWVSGISTEGLTDGVKTTLNVSLKVIGTKDSSRGTVFLLEPLTSY